jgi:acetyl-CoA carboxylase carboxyltransferase component
MADQKAAAPSPSRLRQLSAEVRALEAELRQGGGADKIERQHRQGKLTARERIAGLCDPGTPFVELGLLVAHDRYEGRRRAPASSRGSASCTGATW